MSAAPLHPSRTRALRAIVRALLRLFFRHIAVAGHAHVPTDRGGLVVAWHPNGLIDPALLLTTVPGRVVFGADARMLRWPVAGRLIRWLGAVPIYSAQDAMTPEQRRHANDQSLRTLADEIVGGSLAALFPEGDSHDQPHLAPIHRGAARLVLQAWEQTPPGQPLPVIVPVGLHYEDKDRFRTDVLVTFHPPLDLGTLRLGDPTEADAAQRLTAAIEAALHAAVRPTDSWEIHALMHRARALITAEAALRRGERAAPDTVVSRTTAFAQIWEAYQALRRTRPDEVEALSRDTAAYDHALRQLGLDDLDPPPPTGSAVLVGGAVVLIVAVGTLLPALLLLGFAVNLPPYWLLKVVARLADRAGKTVATAKIIGALVLYPLAWTAAGVLAGFGVVEMAALVPDLPESPLAAGLVIATLSALGGVAAQLSFELARSAWRAVRGRVLRWRHADRLADLRGRRAALYDRFLALADRLPAQAVRASHRR